MEKAAEKGNPDAKALLVNMFFEGDYMGFDTKKAVEYAKMQGFRKDSCITG